MHRPHGEQAFDPDRKRGAKGEDGAALTIVLVALVGLTALAVAGMLLTETELRQSQNAQASVRAFYLADAALNDFLGVSDTLIAPSGSYTSPDGTATVQATQLVILNPDSSMILYGVTAVGSHAPAEGGVATRTVSRLVLWDGGGRNKVSAPGAITSTGGLRNSGGIDSASVSGLDVADPSTCPSAGSDVPGVTVPEDGYSTNGDTSIVSGNPPIEDSYPTGLELAQSLGIDWGDIVGGTGVSFDYVVNSIKDDFPNLSGLGPDDFPVTFVDLSAPSKNKLAAKESGQGLLIATGDIELSGEFHWDGVMLVGGRLEASGGTGVTGALVTGLNVLTTGIPADTTDLGHGGLQFLFNSCYAHKAFKNLGVTPPVVAEEPGTWTETM